MVQRRLRYFCAAALIFVILLGSRNVEAGQQVGERIYADAAESVFLLEVHNPSGDQVATATGFLVAEDKVLTNAHVADAGIIQVRLGPIRLDCILDRLDRLNDLALCTINAKSTAKPIKVAAEDPRPGATVFAIGNPKGLQNTITEGLFTGFRELDGRHVAQISAAISPGSSGGPIFNTAGELVAVASSFLVDGQNLNFAVPLSVVRQLLEPKSVRTETAVSALQYAKRLVERASALEYSDSRAKPIEKEINDTLMIVIDSTSDPLVLAEVDAVATLFRPQVQVEAARKAIQLSKTPSREMYARLANALYYATDDRGPSALLEQAEEAATKTVTLGRSAFGEDLMLLGHIQTQANKHQAAYSNYLKALTVAKPNTEQVAGWYMDLFRVSHELKRDEEADSWYGKAAAIAERSAWESAEHAQFLVDQSKYQQAADAYMAAFRRIPTYYKFVCNAGSNYYMSNSYDQALVAERKCLEVASSKSDTQDVIAGAHRIISDMLTDRGVYEEAAAHAREALSINPEDGFAYFQLARALNGQRRFTEAMSAARNGIRLTDGQYGSMHFELGFAHFELKQWPEAKQAFQKAAALMPDNAAAAYNVAASLENDHFDRDALPWYRETLRRDPNHSGKGEILQRIERLSK